MGDELRDLSNPIISPCKCSGSMGSIHLNCLRKWIEQKVTIRSRTFITSIEWKSLSCELCKSPYPFAVYFYGNILEIINIPYPKGPFMVFEASTKRGGDSGMLYIAKFEKKTSLNIGRSSEADWQLIDSSISRIHAMITYDEGKVYLEDMGSKFGTLKRIVSPIQLQLETKVALQIGSTLCQFKVEKKKSLFSCFGARMKTVKNLDLEDEKEISATQSCFPNNGSHSLLMISKRKYERMIKREEIRSLERKSSEEQKDKVNRKNSCDKLSLCLLDKKKSIPRVASRGVYLTFIDNISIPNGDTADDVVGE